LLGDCASGHCSGGDAKGSSGSCVPSEGKLGLAGYACVDAALCESGKCVNDSCEGGAGYLTAGQYCSDQPHNTLLTQAEANTQCVSGICDLTSNTCLGSAVPFWPSMVCVPAIVRSTFGCYTRLVYTSVNTRAVITTVGLYSVPAVSGAEHRQAG
jgi:hypothetical protein